MRNSFLLAEKKNELFDKFIKINEYILHYNNFNVLSQKTNNNQTILIGNFVDSYNPLKSESEILADLSYLDNFNDLIQQSKKLAGRFVIIHSNKTGLYILPDATSSIQVSYSIKPDFLIVASHSKLIADLIDDKVSNLTMRIQSKSEQNLIMPYDMSIYDSVRYVIPNHYLNLLNQNTTRYYPLEIEESLDINDVSKRTSIQLINIIQGYKNRFGKLTLPLTAGVDSRTILASSKEIIKDIVTFTFEHDNFDDASADIRIPKVLSENFNFRHVVLKDLVLPQSILDVQNSFLEFEVNPSELRNAWTYTNSDFKNIVRLDGNISPLAKSSFGKNLPEKWATSFYFSAKTHNHSSDNKKIIQKWLYDIEPYLEKTKKSKYDLFFWEHRIGKWTSNSIKNFDTMGDSINPFNCREILESWLNVSRKSRTEHSLHELVIKENWSSLLEFPFNPGQKYSFINNNQTLYYFASILKFLLNKLKHKFK